MPHIESNAAVGAPRVRKRHKTVQASLDALAKMPDIPADLIDQFVSGPMSGEDARSKEGDFFILGGQVAYVAEVGDFMRAPNPQDRRHWRQG